MGHKPLDSTKVNIQPKYFRVDPWLFTRLADQPRDFQLVDKERKNARRGISKLLLSPQIQSA